MEENILSPVTEGKIYRINIINIATFFAGPLVGGYMIAINFKTLGDDRKSKITWLFTIVLTMGILSLSLLSIFNTVPNFAYAFLYFLIANLFAMRYQRDAIAKHLQNGGQIYSNSNAFGVALLGIVTLIIIVTLLFLLQDALQPTQF